jgi:two-component system chemotaxis sensor kinase CheA
VTAQDHREEETGTSGVCHVIVFNEGERVMGFWVNEILDIVDADLGVDLQGARPGVVGVAVIAGRATEVLDLQYYFKQAYPELHQGPRLAEKMA